MAAVPLHEDEYLMISGVHHYVYCPRLWALVHIEQQWDDNYFTASGIQAHERADDASLREKRGDVISVRALPVISHRLGLSGRCDVVEFIQDDAGPYLPRYHGKYRAVPVEYKWGGAKIDNSDRYQLLAQLMALEEQLATELDTGYLFYFRTRRREKVVFSDADRKNLQSIVEDMHRLFQRGYTPTPRYKKACKSCSLVNLCLPEMEKLQTAADYLKERIRECENS